METKRYEEKAMANVDFDLRYIPYDDTDIIYIFIHRKR